MVSNKRTRPRSKKGKLPVSLHGSNGQIELAPAEVVDPYDRTAKVLVMRNVSSRPVDALHSRGHLDDAHKAAADKLERLLEDSEIGGVQGFDYSKIVVDTSRVETCVSDVVIRADKALAQVRHELGRRQYDFIVRVLMGGRSVHLLAHEIDGSDPRVGLPSRRTRDFVTDCIRRILDDLVLHFGVGKGPERTTIRVHRSYERELVSG